jgi:hypothetical protein
VSDLVESSTVGSQIVQLGSGSEISDRLRGREATNTEVVGITALEAAYRQRLKIQQTKKNWYVV